MDTRLIMTCMALAAASASPSPADAGGCGRGIGVSLLRPTFDRNGAGVRFRKARLAAFRATMALRLREAARGPYSDPRLRGRVRRIWLAAASGADEAVLRAAGRPGDLVLESTFVEDDLASPGREELRSAFADWARR